MNKKDKKDVNKIRRVHFAALGYQPLRMKPVHFATNFFTSVCGYHYKLEWLNKATVIKFKDDPNDQYVGVNLYPILQQQGIIAPHIDENHFRILRNQLNGIFDNDISALNACFKPYSTFGNDYSFSSDRFLTKESKNHGYSGYFVHQVLESSCDGKAIITFARNIITNSETPLTRIAEPLLDSPEDKQTWDNKYPEQFGDLILSRLTQVSEMMKEQTLAVKQLCQNMESYMPGQAVRNLIIGLCSWLFMYMQKIAGDGQLPLLFMDFLGDNNKRTRSQSCASYARQREKFFQSYTHLWKSGMLACSDEEFAEFEKGGVKLLQELEQHFSDLAVRIGFSQPRAPQVRKKHFELQPDTLKVLMKTVLESNEVTPLEEVALRLRKTWGLCVGCCSDDQETLRKHGYLGLDEDEDLEPNGEAFKALLKRMNLASEPSDGLVLCSINPENLL